MKKIVFLLVLFLSIAIVVVSCDHNNSPSQNNYGDGDDTNNPPLPTATDTDGDTVPDTSDCSPLNASNWQWVNYYVDGDGDNLPDWGRATEYCVGVPGIIQGWTTNPPPPLDNCLNDPTNTCGVTRSCMAINFDFEQAVDYEWTLYGNCFTDALPDPIAPDMGAGFNSGETLIGVPDPAMVQFGSCVASLHFEPAITNNCGIVNWLPCQSSSQVIYSGFNGDGLATFTAWFSPTCTVTDRVQLPVTAEDNGQNGAWFRIGLTNGTGNNGDTNILASILIDTDMDGLLNPSDNCIWVANPDQTATGTIIGANGLIAGNACWGIDSDNDGAFDGYDAFPLDSSQQ